MANTFKYNYNPLTYQNAQKQASGQVDPLFNRAVQGVQQQKYQSDVQAGQVAAARGLGHSGLAADQLNKIAIAAQGQVGDLNAQRATQVAQMANDMVNQDKQYSLQNRAQLYNEYSDNRNFGYQQGRDKIGDQRYTSETAYQHAQDKLANDWKQKEWSQMSPAEKAQMALQYSYSKKVKGSGGGGSGGGSSSHRSSHHSSTSHKKTTKPSAVPKQVQEQAKNYIKHFKPKNNKQNIGYGINGPTQQGSY